MNEHKLFAITDNETGQQWYFYCETVGVALGRAIREVNEPLDYDVNERFSSRTVAVISKEFAERIWGK